MSGRPVFRQLFSPGTDAKANRIHEASQSAVADSIAKMKIGTVLDGRLISDVALTTTPLKISHLLGRQPLGWFVVDANASATVWRTAWDSRSLTLDASGTVTVALWVF